jgi:4-amino-4-deoxy-L-arabinose transferase-like glycosyltransferase
MTSVFARAFASVRARASARPLLTATWTATLGLSAYAAMTLTRVIAGRVTFPFDLEWMEGGMVDHMLRVREGLPLYVAPSFEFVPFIYAPLFYWLGAAASYVTGVGPVALRSVAVLSIIVTCVAAFALIQRATRSRAAACIAVGTFLATYELSGGWMDIARVDSTFLAIQTCAVWIALSERRWAIVAAGALVPLTFLTKQYGAIVVGPIALHYLLNRGWRASAAFTAVAGTLGVLATFLLQASSAGWFWFWTFSVPARHASIGRSVTELLNEMVLQPAPLAATLALLGGFMLAQRLWRDRRSESGLLLSYAAVLAVQAIASYRHAGSYLNCLMPLHLALALLIGFAAAYAPRVGGAFLQGSVLAVLGLQLLLWTYSPGRWIPSRKDRVEAERLTAMLQEEPGRTLFAFRGFFGAPGANPPHAHQMAIGDLIQADYPELTRAVRSEAEEYFSKRTLERVVLDNDDYVLMPELKKHYRLESSVTVGKGPFWSRTGSRMKPRLTYVPR